MKGTEPREGIRPERFVDDCSGVTVYRHECPTCRHFTEPSFGNRNVCAIHGSDMRWHDRRICESYSPLPLERWPRYRRS